MTRTVIRHTLSAIAAVAFVCAFASSPASAQGPTSQLMSNIYKADSDAKLAKPKTPKGLATSSSPRRQFMLTPELQNLNGRR